MNESRRIGSQLRIITEHDHGRASPRRADTGDFADGDEDTLSSPHRPSATLRGPAEPGLAIECSCYTSTPSSPRRGREPIRHRTLRRH